jgi:arylsulfatase A-like enzyme
LAGAKDKTPTTDGISFASTLLGEKQPEREFLYREFHGYGGQQSLRMGAWKLLRMNLMSGGKGKAKAAVLSEELYHIPTDPAERKNLAAENPDIVAQMKKIMSEQHANSPDFPMAALDQ